MYDGLQRRRVRKEFAWESSAWVLTNEVRYLYDGSLVVQERDENNTPLVSYTRGLDLSGSLQGAGGIGGLLARTDHANGKSAFYHADGGGNITALANQNELLVAKYLYDPFGFTLAKDGPLADANTYRFSSKEFHENANLYYYNFRFYDPTLQRWINEDPIGEAGGINLYGFVGNDGINAVDPYGLKIVFTGPAKKKAQAMWDDLKKRAKSNPPLDKTIKEMEKDKRVCKINAVSNSPDVQVGSFVKEAIDVDDLRWLPKEGDGLTQDGALMHEIAEQWAKQAEGIKDYTDAHDRAGKAEALASGNTRFFEGNLENGNARALYSNDRGVTEQDYSRAWGRITIIRSEPTPYQK